MSLIPKQPTRVFALLLFTIYAHADFVESRVGLKNSIMIQLGLFLSSILPRVCIADTGVISGVKSTVARFESKLNLSPVPFPGITIDRVEGNAYGGIKFYFLDEGPAITGTTYTISQGLIYTADDSATYIDSGRTLERYLLNIISQSKVIDSILFEPLSYYVPEPLLTTTIFARRFPEVFHPTYLFINDGKSLLFDLQGRAMPLRRDRNGYQIGVPGIYVSRRSGLVWKSIMITE